MSIGPFFQHLLASFHGIVAPKPEGAFSRSRNGQRGAGPVKRSLVVAFKPDMSPPVQGHKRASSRPFLPQHIWPARSRTHLLCSIFTGGAIAPPGSRAVHRGVVYIQLPQAGGNHRVYTKLRAGFGEPPLQVYIRKEAGARKNKSFF